VSRCGRAVDLVVDFVEHRECKDAEVWGGCDRSHYGPKFDAWELIGDLMMIDPHFHEEGADLLRAQILELGGTLDMPYLDAKALRDKHAETLREWHRKEAQS
jgi:hypothetical protein